MRKRLRIGVRLLAVWLGCGLMTTGCWDYHDINHRTVPVIMGISKGQEKRYKVSLQIPIPAERKLNVKVVSREAATVSEGIDVIRVDVENYIDLLSIQLIVVSQGIAQEGLKDEMANAIRSTMFSPKTLLAVTSGDMVELLSNTKNAITNDITTFYKFANKRAGWTPKTAKTSLMESFVSTRSYTQDILLPIIKPGRETVLEFDGSALMKEGKMIGRLSDQETLFVNVVTNRYYGADVEVLQNASLTILAAHMNWSSRMTGNGPELVGKLRLQTSLSESRTEKSKSQHVSDLETLFSKNLKQVTDKLIQTGADPMGMGNHFRSKIPFEKLAKWRSDYYPELKVRYHVQVEIANLGSLVQAE
ncbi:Ger(x)C family spore germination protein [Paenibacillus rhizovicinus]|uniref:Ger(X)C family spore germination protein n=1 Tax=Paenibacillus rhizovicinus TaxID=2704463 RepID=A0A6C0P3C3_9BACL|nr:Ger(x)C family spore germination protein [Paenibacillus rhizovicinus]QHW31162.1 Ger(x)C family spore germination protein [Paenibacillus rhizovicinus]